jgi:uncharacterized protein (DUF4415 family)
MGTQRKAQRDDRTAFVHVRIERDVLDRFREIAEAEHRTVSQDVRRYIDTRIADADATELRAAA